MGRGASATVRILATNDLCASVDPWPTSYGALPGANSVIEAVSRLSDGQPTYWLDAGDFANWSALASLTGGRAGFEAACELPFDAVCPGNHEFDYGDEPLLEFAKRAPYPVVCANASVALPPATILDGPNGAVGLLGLTSVESVDEAQEATATLSQNVAQLRRDGCRWIIALIHDGVDWAYDTRESLGVRPDATRFQAWWKRLLPYLDLVIAGHTLSRYLGEVGGLPFVQPWAFGAELAVVDLSARGAHRVRSYMPRSGRPWEGAGRDVLETAAQTVHGSLHDNHRSAFFGDHSLADLLARAARAATQADAAMFLSVYAVDQPSSDGVTSWLSAGPVTELDIHRLVPYPHDQLTVVELEPGEWPKLRAALTPQGLPGAAQQPHPGWWQLFPIAPGLAAPARPDNDLLLAFPAHFLSLLCEVLQRTPVAQPGPSLKDALRSYLRTGSTGSRD